MKVGCACGLMLVMTAACSGIPSRLGPPPEPTINGYISSDRAVELAKQYCAETHSPPSEAPRNIFTGFVTCKWAAGPVRGVCAQQPDSLRVWLVTMDGTWIHYGPPMNGTAVPIAVRHCDVVMDAKTGSMISLVSPP